MYNLNTIDDTIFQKKVKTPINFLIRGKYRLLLIYTGEGNGNPLQCSCLENSRDSRAWWAAVYGVAQSWTRLK